MSARMMLFFINRPYGRCVRQARLDSTTALGIKLRKEHYNFSNSGMLRAHRA